MDTTTTPHFDLYLSPKGNNSGDVGKPLNDNFTAIDTSMFNIRTNYASSPSASGFPVGAFWFDEADQELFIETDKGLILIGNFGASGNGMIAGGLGSNGASGSTDITDQLLLLLKGNITSEQLGTELLTTINEIPQVLAGSITAELGAIAASGAAIDAKVAAIAASNLAQGYRDDSYNNLQLTKTQAASASGYASTAAMHDSNAESSAGAAGQSAHAADLSSISAQLAATGTATDSIGATYSASGSAEAYKTAAQQASQSAYGYSVTAQLGAAAATGAQAAAFNSQTLASTYKDNSLQYSIAAQTASGLATNASGLAQTAFLNAAIASGLAHTAQLAAALSATSASGSATTAFSYNASASGYAQQASASAQLAANYGSGWGAAIAVEQQARADADGSLANAITQVGTDYIDTNGVHHKTLVQTQQQSIDGIMGLYSVKVTNNGVVAGFGLMSNLVSGIAQSAFTVCADNFSVIKTASASGAPQTVFIVDSTTGAVGIAGNLLVGLIMSGNWNTTQGSKIDLSNGTITLGGSASPKFQVDKFGVMSCSGAVIRGSLNANDITAGSINTNLLTIGRGANLCPNSDFGSWNAVTGTFFSWYIPQAANIVSGVNGAGASWYPAGINVLSIHQTDAATYPYYYEAYSSLIPVQAGSYYGLSAYTGAHRCEVDVFMYWYDINGTSLNGGNNSAFAWNGTVANYAVSSGGNNLSGYMRTFCYGQAPAAAYFTRVILRKQPTLQGYGYTDSWMFVTRVMFEEIMATTTTPSPWTASGLTSIVGDQINTGIIQSNNWTTSAGSQFDLTNGTIKIGGSSAPKFQVDNTGAVTATGATISGNITLGAGSTITWGGSGVAKPTYAASDVGALPNTTVIPTVPAYIGSTSISSVEIDSPIIAAGLLRSNDSKVYLDLTGKELMMTTGSDSVRLTPGALDFALDGVMYKSVKRIDAGVASNGSYVAFSPAFKTVPRVLCSLHNMTIYNPTYPGMTQSLSLDAVNVTTSGFTAVATLTSTGSQERSTAMGTIVVNVPLAKTVSALDVYQVKIWAMNYATGQTYHADQDYWSTDTSYGYVKIEFYNAYTGVWTTKFDGTLSSSSITISSDVYSAGYWHQGRVTIGSVSAPGTQNQFIYRGAGMYEEYGGTTQYGTGDLNWMAIEGGGT